MTFWIQHGHGKSTKISDLVNAGGVSGVIVSLKDESPAALQALSSSLAKTSVELLVDPQSFLYIMEGGNLGKYEDHALAHSKLTTGMSASGIVNYVEHLIDFNQSIGSDGIIVPSCIHRFDDNWSSISLSVARTAIDESPLPVYASALIQAWAVADWDKAERWLDDATTLDARGFYLVMVHDAPPASYPTHPDHEQLSGFLRLIYRLAENGYSVLFGYSDVEGLLATAVGASGCASGWYNNKRRFAVESWKPRRSQNAKARLFVPAILSPVTVDEAELLNKSSQRQLIPSEYIDLIENGTLSVAEGRMSFLFGMQRLSHDVAHAGPIEDRLDKVHLMLTEAVSKLNAIKTEVPILESSYLRRVHGLMSVLDHFRSVEGI